MCGLFGVIGRNGLSQESIEQARRARDVLTHRGPDQFGEWSDSNSFHGHRRLSIIDLSEDGRQPMCAGDVVITVNGEIYNFVPLRKELQASGFVFKSQSDSEVVLHGYRHWGIEGLVDRIDGMYAATIYDPKKRLFHAIRDRAGIKPFCYHFSASQFVWGSEIKAIRSFVGPEALALDPEAAIDFLTYKFIPAPKSLYRNVFKLPQAQILTLDLSAWQLKTKRYWHLPGGLAPRRHEELDEELRGLVSESVREQLVSDVPLGLFLSGGIDSSLIATHASKNKTKLDCFSISFPGPLDESGHASRIASHLGLFHHVEPFREERLDSYFTEMAGLFDEPFGDASALPTRQVCAFAKRFVTVSLSGDGGDECFGGYNRYRRFSRLQGMGTARRMLRLLSQRNLGLAFRYDPVRAYAELRGSLDGRKLRRWKERLGVAPGYDELWHYRSHHDARRSPLQNARIMDVHGYLPENILTKVDRTSMYHSLECRPPLLSRKLLEFAFRLPDDVLIRGSNLKYGLRQALAADLPRELFERPKKGFGIPVPGWKKKIAAPGMTLEETFLEKAVRGELF